MLKISHRGFAHNHTENSLEAFQEALEQKADMIECDIRLTKDRVAVAFHDKKLDRLTNSKGKLKKTKYKDLKKINLINGEKIPTLDEVCSSIGHKTTLVIDVKCVSAAGIVLKTLKKHKLENKVHITTNYKTLLADLKLRHKSIKCWLSFDLYNYFRHFFIHNLFVAQAKLLNLEGVSVYHKFVSEKMVERAHKNKLKIYVFTVNDLDKMEYFKKLKVDGIITDRLDLLHKL